METLRLVLLFVTVLITADGKPKPTTESTHALLKRLGFDPVQKPAQLTHHSKRIAPLETNKARYHNNDFYSSSSDSRMFVVKLPPHSPYYSHLKPEKFKNDASPAVSKPTSFRTNGKPGQIYHWNIPVLRKLTPEKRGTSVRNLNEDSKVYHIKILPNSHLTTKNSIVPGESHKKNKHKNKQQTDAAKLHKYYRNKLYRFADSQNGTTFAPKTNDNSTSTNSLGTRIHDSPSSDKRLNSNYYGGTKKNSDKYTNEVSKVKSKTNRSPNYYVPAIPQQNSFHKYFTGNGKLKSFYVIEKSKKQTRLHRLL